MLPSAPVLFEMVPPVQVPDEVHAPPLPVTVKPPLEPVVLRMMPLAGPLALDVMLRKVSPLAPMLELATFRAVPVVAVSVLTIVVLSCVALTVAPLPVALKATPEVVVRLSPPVKLTVPPVLVRLMAFAVVVLAVIAPLNALVPPVLALMRTALLALLFLVMVPLKVTFAVLVSWR